MQVRQVRVVWNALISHCGPRLNERPGGRCAVSETNKTNERKKERKRKVKIGDNIEDI